MSARLPGQLTEPASQCLLGTRREVAVSQESDGRVYFSLLVARAVYEVADGRMRADMAYTDAVASGHGFSVSAPYARGLVERFREECFRVECEMEDAS